MRTMISKEEKGSSFRAFAGFVLVQGAGICYTYVICSQYMKRYISIPQ